MMIAKGITNSSIPMGAVLVTDRIYQDITEKGNSRGIEFFHGYTYSAHPVACAAALAVLEIIEREQLVARAREIEPLFQKAVHSLGDLPVVSDVRGIGLMAGVDLIPEATPGLRGQDTLQKLYEAGIMVKMTGDTMLLGPALTIDAADIQLMVSRIADTLADCEVS